MAGTILVREALRRASKLLNDLSPQFTRHPEAGCIDSLNDGALAICKYLPQAGSLLDAVKLAPGTRQSIKLIATANRLPGDGSAAADVQGISLISVVRNLGANGSTPGRVVRIVDRKTLDASDPDWHLAARASTVVRSYSHDPALPHYFYVEPPVHASTAVWVELAYNAQPPRVPQPSTPGEYAVAGSSNVKIPVGDEYIDDLVNYVVARENMKETEWADAQKATYFAGLFVESINGQAAALTGVNPNLKRLPFAPEPVGAAA